MEYIFPTSLGVTLVGNAAVTLVNSDDSTSYANILDNNLPYIPTTPIFFCFHSVLNFHSRPRFQSLVAAFEYLQGRVGPSNYPFRLGI